MSYNSCYQWMELHPKLEYKPFIRAVCHLVLECHPKQLGWGLWLTIIHCAVMSRLRQF